MREIPSDNKDSLIPGQISIFDFEAPDLKAEHAEKPKTCSSLNINDNASMYTLGQKESFLRLKAKRNIERVIWYCSGSLAIETAENKDIITHYINRKGDEEFCFNKRSRVLPMDKILYYDSKIVIQVTYMQNKRLRALLRKSTDEIKRVIRRKGDFNIIVEKTDNILSILPNGWVLEFESLSSVNCSKDEVYINLKDRIQKNG